MFLANRASKELSLGSADAGEFVSGRFWDFCVFRSLFGSVPKIMQKWFQSDPKMVPKWFQVINNWSELGPKSIYVDPKSIPTLPKIDPKIELKSTSK